MRELKVRVVHHAVSRDACTCQGSHTSSASAVAARGAENHKAEA